MATQQRDNSNGASDLRAHCVLVVDDDDDIREVMQGVLEDGGYDVVTAKDGADALERLPSMPRPDLIILDLQMRRLSGAGFMERRDQDPRLSGVPVIVISGDPQGSETARRIGASAYLRKPIALQELNSLVARLSSQG